MLSAEFVIKRAASARNNGGTEYDNGERNKKVFYAESILNVVDKVRKERLLGNTENTQRRQTDVHHFVSLNNFRTKSVKDVPKKVRIGTLFEFGGVLHQKDRDDAGRHGYGAENDKEQPIAVVVGVIEGSEPDKNDDGRKDGQDGGRVR